MLKGMNYILFKLAASGGNLASEAITMWIKDWQTCLAIAVFGAVSMPCLAMPDEGAPNASRQFTFSWQYADKADMAPRGGTSRGEPVVLASGAGEQWTQLRTPGLTDKERDRRAILAMAGPYRASFDFIETVGFSEGYLPVAPYQSWGTEFVYVVKDEPNFISLQHIMVLRFEAGEDFPSEPVVIKHWRQDWRYQQRDLHTFRGHRTWQLSKQSRSESRGRWVQSVYQVDDSPRYSAAGSWKHRANFSSWVSDETWRPLPRREFSVRNDYDALIGTNQHTITPTGWVQEELNLKAVLDDKGEVTEILARENGVARYERIEEFDWQAGNDYWDRTAAFWAIVRDVWTEHFQDENTLTLRETAEGVPLYMEMFEMADSSQSVNSDSGATREAVREMLQRYITEG